MAIKVKISEFPTSSFVSGSDLIPLVRSETGVFSNKAITVSQVKTFLSEELPIGTPTDGVYTDGFFDTLTPSSSLSDTIDEISEAFLDLAPSKAGILTSTNLSSTGMTLYSGYLASGLNSNWYSGSYTAGSSITTFLNQPSVILRTTGSGTSSPMTFRSGKYSDFSSLSGGVTASFSTGSNATVIATSASLLNSTGSVVSSSLSIGTGLLPTTFINGTTRYNTFWTQTSASISHSISITGSSTYQLSSTNAGTTNAFTLWYANETSNDYPDQSVVASASVSSANLKYLSGIPYLSSSTVMVSLTASNLHNPVYNSTPISFAFSNPTIASPSATGSVSIPAHNTNISLSLSVNNSTADLISSSPWTTTPSLVVTVTKPGKSNANSGTVTVYNRPVNNYSNPASITTNGSNTIVENFYDEYYRLGNLKSGSLSTYASNFPSQSNLQTVASSEVLSQLETQNGRLIAPGNGNYSGFTSGSSENGYANYFRRLDILSDNVESGQLTMSFSGFNTIKAWGTTAASGTGPEVALILSSSITGDQTYANLYDLGLGTGLYSGSLITGSQNSAQSNISTGKVAWALPLGVNTGPAATNHLILWIRYKNASTNYIDDITFKV